MAVGSVRSAEVRMIVMMSSMSADGVLSPKKLWSRAEVVDSRPSPVPKAAGLYAWYFRQVPGRIDTASCHLSNRMPMLYVGIAPKQPYADGRRSKTTLHQRVRHHYTGSAEGSTLRLTLGCLLSAELAIELRRVGSGTRRTFSDGERALSRWIAANAFVCWTVHAEPWKLEEELISRYDLPLNLDQNKHNAFHPELSQARRAAKQRASELPVLAR
jgi:hypothetical protein